MNNLIVVALVVAGIIVPFVATHDAMFWQALLWAWPAGTAAGEALSELQHS